MLELECLLRIINSVGSTGETQSEGKKQNNQSIAK